MTSSRLDGIKFFLGMLALGICIVWLWIAAILVPVAARSLKEFGLTLN
jgi:hypothetical protein